MTLYKYMFNNNKTFIMKSSDHFVLVGRIAQIIFKSGYKFGGFVKKNLQNSWYYLSLAYIVSRAYL